MPNLPKLQTIPQPSSVVAPNERVGILLTNLGTPDGTDYWSVRRYLSEFLSDKRIVDMPSWIWQPILQLVILTKRPFKSGAAYRSIWNIERDESPLLTITRDQTAAIRNQLHKRYGDAVLTDFAMRYGNPSIRSKVEEMQDAGCSKILFFPLYPQYSGATTATANDQLFRTLMKQRQQPVCRSVEPYFNDAAYIDALAQSIETAYVAATHKPEVLVCSYHGLPESHIQYGDPYYDQCLQTTHLLQQRLGWTDDKICSAFQSRFGPREWVKPYTSEEVARLAKDDGVKNIAICAPAFAADCIETLEEINDEIRESFEQAGGKEFTYIPCLNDNPAHIEFLSNLIERNLNGWLR